MSSLTKFLHIGMNRSLFGDQNVIYGSMLKMLLYSSRGIGCFARLNSRRGYNQQIFLLHPCGHLVESCYIEYGSSPGSRDSSTILWIWRHGYYFRLHKSRLCGSCIITFLAILVTQDVWIIIFIKMYEIVCLGLNTLS